MLNFQKLLLFLLVCSSCTTDLAELPEVGNEIPLGLPAIAVLGETEGTVYQSDVSATLTETVLTDLTAEIGIIGPQFVVYGRNGLVTGLVRNEGRTQVWQRNVDSGEVYTLQDFCAEQSAIAIFTASGSENYLGLLFDALDDDEERFFLNVFEKTTERCIQFDLGLSSPSAAFQFESIYGVYRINGNERTLTLVDMERERTPGILSLSEDFNFATVNNRLLYLFYTDGRYEIYDIDGYKLLQEGKNTALMHTTAVGFLATVFAEEQMLYYSAFPAPSVIAVAPEIYDFATDQVIKPSVDLFQLKTSLEGTLGSTVTFSDIQIDFKRSLVLVGYSLSIPDIIGGVVYLTFDGTVLNSVPLKHDVRSILIKE
ncbi:hypothetical protein [Maribacter sp. 2-571]|uniref:hypothetical protein n=1 Tax=Maribacter sp. 2-571 TaxID=3417569 RepID=UPI003D32508F